MPTTRNTIAVEIDAETAKAKAKIAELEGQLLKTKATGAVGRGPFGDLRTGALGVVAALSGPLGMAMSGLRVGLGLVAGAGRLAFGALGAGVQLLTSALRFGLGAAVTGVKVAFGGMAAAGAAAVGATYAALKALQPAAEQEQQTQRWTAILGNPRAARRRVAELDEFSRTSPFNADSVNQAATAMQNYGFYSMRTLRAVADAAAGMGRDISEGMMPLMQLREGQFNIRSMARFGITRRTLQAEGVTFDKGGELKSSGEEALAAVVRSFEHRFGGASRRIGSGFLSLMGQLRFALGETMESLGEKPLQRAKGLVREITAGVWDMEKRLRGLDLPWIDKLTGAVKVVRATLGTVLEPQNRGAVAEAVKDTAAGAWKLGLAMAGGFLGALKSDAATIGRNLLGNLGEIASIVGVALMATFRFGAELLKEAWRGLGAEMQDRITGALERGAQWMARGIAEGATVGFRALGALLSEAAESIPLVPAWVGTLGAKLQGVSNWAGDAAAKLVPTPTADRQRDAERAAVRSTVAQLEAEPAFAARKATGRFHTEPLARAETIADLRAALALEGIRRELGQGQAANLLETAERQYRANLGYPAATRAKGGAEGLAAEADTLWGRAGKVAKDLTAGADSLVAFVDRLGSLLGPIGKMFGLAAQPVAGPTREALAARARRDRLGDWKTSIRPMLAAEAEAVRPPPAGSSPAEAREWTAREVRARERRRFEIEARGKRFRGELAPYLGEAQERLTRKAGTPPRPVSTRDIEREAERLLADARGGTAPEPRRRRRREEPAKALGAAPAKEQPAAPAAIPALSPQAPAGAPAAGPDEPQEALQKAIGLPKAFSALAGLRPRERQRMRRQLEEDADIKEKMGRLQEGKSTYFTPREKRRIEQAGGMFPVSEREAEERRLRRGGDVGRSLAARRIGDLDADRVDMKPDGPLSGTQIELQALRKLVEQKAALLDRVLREIPAALDRFNHAEAVS